jgi:hypothetical protein
MKLSGGTGCANSYLATTSLGEGGTALCGGRRGIALSATRRNSLGGAGRDKGLTDAHPRGAAVAQRLRSALLAGFCLCIRMGDRKQTDVAQSQPRLIFP